MSLRPWLHGTQDIHLSADEVHIWRAWLDRDTSMVEEFWSALTVDERRRAERFQFDRDRRNFVSARGILKDIIARYLRKSPAEIRFTYNKYGKPALAGSKDGPHFNVSHSNGAALYAFSWTRELGVDLELLRDDVAILEIAERFFSAWEVRALRSLSPRMRLQGFFNCWTRKEAYIKALGEGLTHPLDRFVVSLAPDEHTHVVSTDDDPQQLPTWSIIDLTPFHGYAAALAVSGNNPEVHCWDW